MLRTHYTLMNLQEGGIKRLLPIQLVAYNFFMCLVHTGMTMDTILKMDNKKFGQLFGECCQINVDGGLVPYKRDFSPGFTISMTGGLKLVARDTENMVSPPPHVAPLVPTLDRLWFAGVAVRRASVLGQDREASGAVEPPLQVFDR